MSVKKALGLIGAGLSGVAAHDLLQRKHAILRNYPVVGHLRYLLEEIRPEIQQYFIERNWDGRPFDRDTRSIIYERAKATLEEQPFGTEREVESPGYEYLIHTIAPVPEPATPPRVVVGGPDCSKPYSMSVGIWSGRWEPAISDAAPTTATSTAPSSSRKPRPSRSGLSR